MYVQAYGALSHNAIWLSNMKAKIMSALCFFDDVKFRDQTVDLLRLHIGCSIKEIGDLEIGHML